MLQGLNSHPSRMKTKSAEGDPAALLLTDIRLENFVGEEAPVARAGPRSPDVFYRGEEAGAALKPTDNNEMEAPNPKHSHLTVTEF